VTQQFWDVIEELVRRAREQGRLQADYRRIVLYDTETIVLQEALRERAK
jgi:hypothetical protein